MPKARSRWREEVNSDKLSATSSDGFLSTGLRNCPDSVILAAAAAPGRHSPKTPQTPRDVSTFGQDKTCGRRLSKACAGSRSHAEKDAMRLFKSEAAAAIHTTSMSRFLRSQVRCLAIVAHICAISTTMRQCRIAISAV